MPVYSFGLCEAVTVMPPSSPSAPTAKYSISVPIIPTSTTSAPPSRAPRTTASAIEGEESRMSRPTAIRRGLELLGVRPADRVGPFLVELRPG